MKSRARSAIGLPNRRGGGVAVGWEARVSRSPHVLERILWGVLVPLVAVGLLGCGSEATYISEVSRGGQTTVVGDEVSTTMGVAPTAATNPAVITSLASDNLLWGETRAWPPGEEGDAWEVTLHEAPLRFGKPRTTAGDPAPMAGFLRLSASSGATRWQTRQHKMDRDGRKGTG